MIRMNHKLTLFSGCPLVSLSQLPQGILFDSILNETTVTTSGSCLRECFLHDQCLFASYSQSTGECKIVSPCSTVSCTHQISTEFETYKMGCTRGKDYHPLSLSPSLSLSLSLSLCIYHLWLSLKGRINALNVDFFQSNIKIWVRKKTLL